MARGSDEAAANHPNPSSTLHLVPDKAQIGTARRFVCETLAAWGLGRQTGEIEVAACELVTNAMVHGEGGVDVTVLRLADRLRVEVVDEGFDSRPIQTRDASMTGRGGWGLRLVERISDTWGADRRPGRTLVWMERRLPNDDQNRTHDPGPAARRQQQRS